jgi:glutamate--cysteine ligase
MLIRQGDDFHPVFDHLTFDDWLGAGHELGWPDVADLDYHLTTLFPPVRPRGWFELRFLDAVPEPWWRVAAVAATLSLDDDACSAAVEAATRATGHLWCEAASMALRHPDLSRAAQACFRAVLDAADRAGLDATTLRACTDFYDRYVGRGRCPADDWS